MPETLAAAAVPGTFRYNGFDFAATGCTPPSYRLEGRPVFDAAGRTVTHLEYLLRVSCLLHGETEAATAETVEAARRLLMRSAKRLELSELGLGEMRTGRGGTHREIAWGPRPKLLALEPAAGRLAWQLEWECTFRVTEPGAAAARDGWLGFDLETTWEIDDRGFTTRLLRGAIDLPAPSAEGRNRSALAHARRRLALPVPRGFRRVLSRWNEGAGGARLAFEIRDEQLKHGPLPAGIAAADVRWQVRFEGAAGEGPAPIARLHGSLETVPGAPAALGVSRLMALAADRRTRLEQAAAGGLVIPGAFSIEQQLYARTVSFDVPFHLVGARAELLISEGLWAPAPSEGEQAWRSFMEPLWAPSGLAEAHGPAAAVIDLVEHPANRLEITASVSNRAQVTARASPAPRLIPTLTPTLSWLVYRPRVRLLREEQVTRHLVAQRVRASGAGSNASFGPPFAAAAPGYLREVHGAPRIQVVLEGEAERLGWLPAPPRLTSYGGRPAIEASREETLEPLGRFANQPRYRLRWRITYDVDGQINREMPE